MGYDADTRFDKFLGGKVNVSGEFSILLNPNACVARHTLDKKVVGPSFREVAAKFAGDGGAAGRLAKKIREGGAGNWGNVPMPPHPQLSDADLGQIVGWILQQR